MSQPRPSSSTWSRIPTAEIPSEQWVRWLDPINHPSPYLLPEWALFWVQVWPQTRAEVWQSSDIGVSTVTRQRMGQTWTFALPYGTPGGWLGKLPAEASAPDVLSGLVGELGADGAVQIALSVDDSAPEVAGWKRTAAASPTWVIDMAGATASELDLNLSESHRRNIEKGAKHDPIIKPVTDSQAAIHLFEVWPVPSEHRSRIVLNPALSAALMSTFALSPALRWLTAWVKDKPMATSLWLVLHDRAVYVDGATVRDREFTGSSHHLFHHVLKLLYREGVRHFDLGSGPKGKSSAGLTQFKEGWGGQPETRTEVIYRRPWYHWLRKIM